MLLDTWAAGCGSHSARLLFSAWHFCWVLHLSWSPEGTREQPGVGQLVGQTHHCCGPQSHRRAGSILQVLQIFFLSVFTKPSWFCLSRQERSCLAGILHSWGSSCVVPTREMFFLSRELQTEASQSLGGVAAVRLHTFSLDWTPQSSCSDGWSGTFSHGPIHLSFLADPLCPSPFFQLPLHPPQAAQQPSLVSQCSQVDLGREAPSCGVSQAEGEEHSLGKSSSRFIPATCRMFPEGSATERGETGGP